MTTRLCCLKIQRETNINNLEFRYASFWIHFHNLPPICFCRKYTEALGNAIGEFEDVVTDDSGKISGESLRVRVKIDTNEPIKEGHILRRDRELKKHGSQSPMKNCQTFVTSVGK